MYRVALILGAQVGYGPVIATEVEARERLEQNALVARSLPTLVRLDPHFTLEWQDDDGEWIEIDAIQV